MLQARADFDRRASGSDSDGRDEADSVLNPLRSHSVESRILGTELQRGLPGYSEQQLLQARADFHRRAASLFSSRSDPD